MNISLGANSLAGASFSGVATALTKKHQKKLAKVTKLIDIMTLALAVFETSISKALNDGRVDEQEFGMFHLGVLKNWPMLTDMAKRLLKQPKHSLWNIKCGNTEYIHCEYLPGCHFSGWS